MKYEPEKIREELLSELSKIKTDRKNINQIDKEIRRAIYKFIAGKILKEIKIKTEDKDNKKIELVWQVFRKTVDFMINYGFIINGILSELRQYQKYQEYEEYEFENKEIDA